MAAPTYSTDLTLIDDAQNVSSYVATGGGASGLNDETDYFINNTQCISKNGFTASQRGMLHDDVTAPTITAGDAVFIWGRQANRNILNTLANSGGAVIMGTSNSAFAGFNVDGSDVEGSALLSWVNYAVDPTQTSDYTSGSPGAASTWDHFGMEWNILGSGSLKGAPNAVGVIRHGREARAVDGDAVNGYATFTGLAAFDSDVTRRWGILTEATGTLLFHGAIVLGQSGTSVDFRDSDVSISVLDDPHVPAAFNEIQIQNASSNVEWTSIQIAHLASPATSPTTLTLDVGTFTGEACRFDGCGTTTFNADGSSSCTNTTWVSSGRINLNEANIRGSSVLTSTVAADEGAIFDDRTTTTDTSISELDNCTISKGANAHHAIRFGANVDDNITLTGIEFTGFNGTDSQNDSTIRFDDTTGSINLTLVNCTVDGAAASESNIGIDSAGISVTIVTGAVDVTVTTVEDDGGIVGSANAFLKARPDARGTHTGADNASVLTDSSKSFTTNEFVGNTIRNVTDGSSATITANTATTVTGTLSGGTDNDYDAGDEYIITSGPFPVEEVVTITRSATTATVSHTAHGMATNDKVLIEGITDKEQDNAVHQITVSDANTYTYTTTDSGSTSYTGTITSTFVLLEGLTDSGTGVLTVSRVYSSDQPFTGWTRKSTSAPYFRQADLNGIVSSSDGADITAVMVSDE